VVHGGVGSPPAVADGPQAAAAAAVAALRRGGSSLDAAVAGTVALENDPRFNAGTGANIRLDGRTIQMDAALMTGEGRFAAVGAIERVRNPILVARAVMDSTPHLFMAGEGATRFAHLMGFEDVVPTCPEAEAKFQARMKRQKEVFARTDTSAWDWRRYWNFPNPMPPDVLAWRKHGDTVGTVARDSLGRFAATLSTGGTSVTLYGRVGDVPVYGCGLYAGPAGAVACTGEGEEIITGQGPSDPFQQQTLRASGWQPYSFKIGDRYIPYNRFEPLATILGIGADIVEAQKRGDTQTTEELLLRGLSSLQQNLTNKTFLQGLESFFNFWSDPKRSAASFAKQLVMSAVPNTIGLIPFGTAARAIDPVYRQTTLWNAAQSKIPFASKLLPKQYGTLGETRLREGNALTRLALPIQFTKERHTPAAKVAREIDRIGMSIQRPRTYVRSEGGRYDFSPEDQKLLAGAQSSAIEAIANIIASEGYRALPDNEGDPRAALGAETKEDVIRKVLMQYRRPVLNVVNTRARQALATKALTTLRGEQ
jgi:isoaspartyl peptidase/L-asparaginase-like protein (Ntn-hydrolase superfamily)